MTTLGPKGLPATVQVPGILPVVTDYWDDGKLKTLTQGTRVTQFTYDANGNLETLTGPEGVALAFTNDLRLWGIVSQADIALAAGRDNEVTEREIALVVEQISEPTRRGGGLDRFTETQISPRHGDGISSST